MFIFIPNYLLIVYGFIYSFVFCVFMFFPFKSKGNYFILNVIYNEVDANKWTQIILKYFNFNGIHFFRCDRSAKQKIELISIESL